MTIYTPNTVESLSQRIAATRKRLCALSTNAGGDALVAYAGNKVLKASERAADDATPSLDQRIAATRKRLLKVFLDIDMDAPPFKAEYPDC